MRREWFEWAGRAAPVVLVIEMVILLALLLAR